MDTDNQQQTVKETDLAWLAGFLEGEGTIQLTVPQSKNGRQHRVMNLWIELNNTDAAMIQKAIDVFEALGVGHLEGNKFIKPVYKEDGTYYESTKKICLYTRICKLQNIQIALSRLLPYMFGNKRHIAEIALRFCERRLRQGRRAYEEEDLMIAQEFFKTSDGRFATRNVELLDRMLRDFTPNTQ